MTFNHFPYFKQARYIHILKNTESFCFFKPRFYFLENSFFKQYVFDVWKNVRSRKCIRFYNPDALMSRILYVQAREPSSMYAQT